MDESSEPQQVPVKLYRTPDRLTVAAPMPGLMAEDIVVEVADDGRLTLHGEPRGSLKAGDLGGLLREAKEVLLDEWDVGGYHRELPLPLGVDGELATLTYGNGILVVALPVAERSRPARLTLRDAGPGRAERVGSAGHPVLPLSTEEHWAARNTQQAEHGGAAGTR